MPPSVMPPERVGSAPTMARMSVVLTAPLRPMRPHSDPGGTESETARRIGVAPMLTSSRSISSMPAPRDVGANAGVAQHVIRRAVSQDATLVEGEDAPAVARHDVDVVLDEH